MNQPWHIPAKVPVQKNVFRCGIDPLLTADDICDLHQVIVNYDCQVIGGQTICFEQDLHVDLAPGDGDVSAQLIMNNTFAVIRDLQPYNMAITSVEARTDISFRESKAVSIVSRCQALAHL